MRHKLRAEAAERECQIWLGGCTTYPAVLCHFRLQGISGMGIKPPDLLGAWGCSACHTQVDTDKSPEVQLQFAKGVFRTQMQLLREGKITDGD